MDVTLGRQADAAAPMSVDNGRGVERATSSTLSLSTAIAMLIVGDLIETLGLALIAAYGSVIVGVAIFGFGLGIGMLADRRWPDEPGQPGFSVLRSCLSIARSSLRDARNKTRPR
jgi:hypothetical protein